MIRGACSQRELTWRLFMRDFRARYSQAFLGFLWAFILPLVVVGTFLFLNRSGVLTIGDVGVPYAVYAILGISVWQIFAAGLVRCGNAIVAGGSMVVKINFPKDTLVFAAMGQALVDFIVRMLMVGVLMAVYGLVPKWEALLFLPAILPMILFSLGLGFIFSLANVVFRDISHMLTILTTFLMFATPVLYPSRGGLFAAFNRYNPLDVLVNAPRELVVSGTIQHPVRFAVVSLMAVLLFLLTWRIFHLAEVRMAERMGTR